MMKHSRYQSGIEGSSKVKLLQLPNKMVGQKSSHLWPSDNFCAIV